MSAPVEAPVPVDTGAGDDEPVHVACRVRDRTWCGLDASGIPWLTVLPPLGRVCRVCVLAFEMHRPGDPCPVCGTHACIA